MLFKSCRNFFKRKYTVIYTSIFGDYDDLKDIPDELARQCDLICFTDNRNLTSRKYRIFYCDRTGLGPSKESRRYKILPHLYLPSGYRYSIWADASIRFNNFTVSKIIEKYLTDADWAVFPHQKRECIYEELDACRLLDKDDYSKMKNQVDRYSLEGYPKGNGLTENGFIVRRHDNPEVIKVNEDWWQEVEKNSTRDQLSFCYVAWKHNFKYNVINENIWDNQYFRVLRHKQSG